MRLIALILLVLAALGGYFFVFKYNRDLALYQQLPDLKIPFMATPTPIEGQMPSAKTLNTSYHIFQTFNNCGPASLSMTLSYYGVTVSQKELGDALRPYQIPSGDNDDKSVTLDEMAAKAQEYGLIAYHRPNGNVALIKRFIAADLPVIANTWLKKDDDIGHYRVVKGYDETRKILIQDDSFQGKNIKFTYDDFNAIWKKYNYEYLVLVPKEKQRVVEEILAEDKDYTKSWKRAAENEQALLKNDPGDFDTRFNLAVALYNIGDFEGSVREFEQVENVISFRTLWYQIEPIQAYYELGNYNRVLEITDRVLNHGNRAFSELYILRGKIYQKQGNTDAARAEFEKAVLYNKNLKAAQDALESL